MKIALISFFSGHNERGTERWTSEIAEQFANNHEITVFQNGKQNKPVRYETFIANLPANWNIADAAGGRGWRRRFFVDYWSLKIAQFCLYILPFLWRRKYDIIIPTDGGWEPAFIRLLTWLQGKKMVIVGHAGLGWDDKNNIWSFPDTFVALSEKAKKWARQVNPFIKIQVIPDGINLEVFKPVGKKFDLKLKKPIVLCVSALNPGKRIDKVIRAVAELHTASLFVVGKGEEKEDLQKLGYELLGNRFLLSSFSFDKMPEVYRSANVFASASMGYHSFEIVILEALATNLPVVVNDDEIRKEIVGSGGYLIDPENTKDFAKAIERSLNTSWSDKPRRQAELFSLEKVTAAYTKLFEDLLNY